MTAIKTRVAIAYDFDGTLAPGNMQEHQFLPEIRMKKDVFWGKVSELAKANEADEILVYMNLMIEEARHAHARATRSDFYDRGKTIELFLGLDSWFDRINEYARQQDLIAEHYIISSGNKELIEGTSIANKFKKIYASTFWFDENDVAKWPALAVNYTNKTQFLFRINKGALDVHDKKGVNAYVPEEERPIPFDNIIFIGDGETDIPCFRLVKDKGGLSVAVYKPRTNSAKRMADSLKVEGRVHCSFPANYSEGEKVEKIVKAKIDEIAVRSNLLRLSK